MESATNVLREHYRHVLVRAVYGNAYVRVRFKADEVPGIYFNKTQSQLEAWQKNGGTLLTWKNNNKEGAHDAIVVVECPKSIEILYKAIQPTRYVGVIYDPPKWVWTANEEDLRRRAKPMQLQKRLDDLAQISVYVKRLPDFTPASLPVPEESSRPSAAPSSHEDAAHSPRKTC